MSRLADAKRALVINCSAPHYNLGVAKLVGWLLDRDWDVDVAAPPVATERLKGVQLVCLSVIFSWHAPIAREIALVARGTAEVWCGGPGISALTNWWTKETGLSAVKGLDSRFERQRGFFDWTFSARGCPVGCSFCIVPSIEGSEFTLDWDFVPAPNLGDNNLSALPAAFQDHIIRRYVDTGTRLVDANSGFEPRTFTSETYQRWRGIISRSDGGWRFAFDEQREAPEVYQLMRVLKGEKPRRKRCYVLTGNEPIEACFERALNVIDWGGEPWCQPVRRLNALSYDDLWVRHDWTPRLLRDFARYFNLPQIWRNTAIEDYRPRLNEPPPFAGVLRSPRKAGAA